MSEKQNNTQRLIELVTDLQLDGPTPERVAELQALLAANESLRRLYVDLINLDGLLGEAMDGARTEPSEAKHPSGDSGSMMAALLELDEAAGEVEPVELKLVASVEPASRGQAVANESGDRVVVIPKLAVWGGLAAAVLLLAVVLWPSPGETPADPSLADDHPTGLNAAPDTGPDRPIRVGQVVGSLDGAWADGSSVSDGQAILNQSVTLTQGIAQIELTNGVRVTLEAPCTFEPISPDRVHLTQGKLVGKVPPNAVGFTVETPTHRVVDLSTEFGVYVSPQQQTQVSVFVGSVAWMPNTPEPDTNPTYTPQILTAGRSLVLDRETGVQNTGSGVAYTRDIPVQRREQVARLNPLVAWSFDQLESGLFMDRGTLGINVEAGLGTELADAQFGKAFVLTPSMRAVTLNNTERIDLTGPLTVEAWVRVDATGHKSMRLLTNRSAIGGLGLGLGGGYYAGDNVTLFDREGASFKGGCTNVKLSFFKNADLVTQGEVPTGVFAHIVAVLDPAGLPRVYINGQPQRLGVERSQLDTFQNDCVLLPSNEPFVLGRNTHELAEPFDGLVDEFAIYPSALTQEQVLGLYRARPAADPEP